MSELINSLASEIVNSNSAGNDSYLQGKLRHLVTQSNENQVHFCFVYVAMHYGVGSLLSRFGVPVEVFDLKSNSKVMTGIHGYDDFISQAIDLISVGLNVDNSIKPLLKDDPSWIDVVEHCWHNANIDFFWKKMHAVEDCDYSVLKIHIDKCIGSIIKRFYNYKIHSDKDINFYMNDKEIYQLWSKLQCTFGLTFPYPIWRPSIIMCNNKGRFFFKLHRLKMSSINSISANNLSNWIFNRFVEKKCWWQSSNLSYNFT